MITQVFDALGAASVGSFGSISGVVAAASGTGAARGTGEIDLALVGRTAAYFVGMLVIVVLAKLGRDALALKRGQNLTQLVSSRDKTPVAVEAGAFILAMVIGLTGSLVVDAASAWEEALGLLATGAVVFAVLLANDQLVSRLLLGGLDCNRAVAEDQNLCVAIVRGAGMWVRRSPWWGRLGMPRPYPRGSCGCWWAR